MITHSDEGPDFEPDDPLAVILRPTSDYLGPPPGRYEAIRRGAARRRLVRTAVGVGSACAVAALVALPLRLSTSERPTSPTVPLAPPSAGPPSAARPTPSASPVSVSPRPTQAPRTVSPTHAPRTVSPTPSSQTVPTSAPSKAPASPSVAPSAASASPSVESSVAPTGSPLR